MGIQLQAIAITVTAQAYPITVGGGGTAGANPAQGAGGNTGNQIQYFQHNNMLQVGGGVSSLWFFSGNGKNGGSGGSGGGS